MALSIARVLVKGVSSTSALISKVVAFESDRAARLVAKPQPMLCPQSTTTGSGSWLAAFLPRCSSDIHWSAATASLSMPFSEGRSCEVQ